MNVIRSMVGEIILEDKATSAIRGLNRSMDGFKAKFTNAFGRANEALKGLSKGGDGLANTLANVATAIGAERGLARMKEIGAEAVAAAAEMERIRTSFGVILGNQTQADKLVDTLEAMSVASPFGAEQLASASKQLLLAGATAKQQVPILEQIGDISAVSGASLDELADSYAKSMSRGTVTSKEMLSLVKNNIPIIETLADSMGVAREDVIAMADSGMITFEDFTAALTAMTSAGGKFYKGQEKMLGTWEGMTKLLRTIRGQILEAFGTTFIEVMKPFAEALIAAGKWLLVLLRNANIVKAGLVAFGTVFAMLATVMAASAYAMMAPAIALLTVLWPYILVIGLITAAIIALVVWRRQIVDFFKRWGGVILAMLGPVGILIKLIIELARVLWASREKIGAFFEGFYSGFMKTFGAIDAWYHRNQKWLGPLMTYWALTIPGGGLAIGAGKALLDATPEARAQGGPVAAGSPYLVGERGPELFTPRTSGDIIPNIGRQVRIGQIIGKLTINANSGQVGASLRDEIVRALDDVAIRLAAEGI